MDAPSFRISFLPAPLIIKDFVENKKDCNYEVYMRELLNNSKFFLSKSNQELFVAPETEESGQSDCNSNCYSLDLKLLLPETAGLARREFSDSIVQFNEGVWGYGSPRITTKDKNYKPVKATLFHAVLSHIGYDDLLKYENSNVQKKGLERDVNRLLKDMQTRKNLLCLIPYRFTFDKDAIRHSDGQSIIANAVAKDYGILFEYRERKHNNTYETFISFLYDGSMTILGKDKGKIRIVDEIPLKDSKTYLELAKFML